eukprot:2332629-Pyramimonas_sp.AAC.1
MCFDVCFEVVVFATFAGCSWRRDASCGNSGLVISTSLTPPGASASSCTLRASPLGNAGSIVNVGTPMSRVVPSWETVTRVAP